jgi:hypothetical protein
MQNPKSRSASLPTLSLPQSYWSPWSLVIRVTNVTIMITMVINSTITMLIMSHDQHTYLKKGIVFF